MEFRGTRVAMAWPGTPTNYNRNREDALMNFKVWTWAAKRRERRMHTAITIGTAIANQLALALKNHPANVNHHVTHAPRPSQPRPEQITLIWTYPDGRQYRQFFPLRGQSWIESVPGNFIWSEDPQDRPVSIEMAITYRDTGSRI